PHPPHVVTLDTPPPSQPPTLPLHDALPILPSPTTGTGTGSGTGGTGTGGCPPLESLTKQQRFKLEEFFHREHGRFPVSEFEFQQDRKSTRLNSSHRTISYAVFCLKKKKSIR